MAPGRSATSSSGASEGIEISVWSPATVGVSRPWRWAAAGVSDGGEVEGNERVRGGALELEVARAGGRGRGRLGRAAGLRARPWYGEGAVVDHVAAVEAYVAVLGEVGDALAVPVEAGDLESAVGA